MNFLFRVHFSQIPYISPLVIIESYGLTIGANMAAPASQINSGSEMIASGNIVIILVSFIHPSKLEYDHHS